MRNIFRYPICASCCDTIYVFISSAVTLINRRLNQVGALLVNGNKKLISCARTRLIRARTSRERWARSFSPKDIRIERLLFLQRPCAIQSSQGRFVSGFKIAAEETAVTASRTRCDHQRNFLQDDFNLSNVEENRRKICKTLDDPVTIQYAILVVHLLIIISEASKENIRNTPALMNEISKKERERDQYYFVLYIEKN